MRVMTKHTALGWLLVFVQVLVFLGFGLLPWRSPNLVLALLGLILIVCGLVVVFATFKALGSALTATPVPREGAALRTQGIFAVVRHPIYSGLLLALLGFVIAVGSWWTLTWWVITVLFFWGKSRWEDSLLSTRHPGEWEIWALETPALIPYRKRSAH